MANTVIQLKYSEITATPASLNVAEPAYSNSSGKLYIGNSANTPVLIGGKYYVDRVDEATSANLITFPNSKLSDVQLDSVLGQLYYISIAAKTISNKQAVVDYLKRVTQQNPDTVKALTKRHYEKLKDPNYKVEKKKNTKGEIMLATSISSSINENVL